MKARGHNLPGTEQQYDGTFGGRIVRDKTFFHLSFLELRQGSTSATEMVTFTPAGRARFGELFPARPKPECRPLQDLTAGYNANFRNFNVDLGDGTRECRIWPGHFQLSANGTRKAVRNENRSTFQRSRHSGRPIPD